MEQREEKMEEILAKLNEWGCNVDVALERLIGDKEFYVDCLKVFKDDENFFMLKDSLDKKDYKQCFDCAHTLKGIAANLGLKPVCNATSKIIEKLRAEDYSDLKREYEMVHKEHIKLIEIVT